MAVELIILKKGFNAGADLSAVANQFKFVKLDASGNVILCAATTDVPVGILQNTPKLNGTADVLMLGISKVQASAALAIGDQIGTDAAGLARANVPGTDTTKYIVGRVLAPAPGAAGGIFTATINTLNPHRAA